MNQPNLAAALLEAVLSRPKGQSIEAAIDEFAKKVGLDMPPAKRDELARAIIRYSN